MPLLSLRLESHRWRLFFSILLLLVSGALILANFNRAPGEAATMVQDPQALTRRGKIAWREIIDLTPGTYILRATNDESWRCRITITPR